VRLGQRSRQDGELPFHFRHVEGTLLALSVQLRLQLVTVSLVERKALTRPNRNAKWLRSFFKNTIGIAGFPRLHLHLLDLINRRSKVTSRRRGSRSQGS